MSHCGSLGKLRQHKRAGLGLQFLSVFFFSFRLPLGEGLFLWNHYVSRLVLGNNLLSYTTYLLSWIRQWICKILIQQWLIDPYYDTIYCSIFLPCFFRSPHSGDFFIDFITAETNLFLRPPGAGCCYISRWSRLFYYKNSRYSVLSSGQTRHRRTSALFQHQVSIKKFFLFDLLKFFLAKLLATWQNCGIQACWWKDFGGSRFFWGRTGWQKKSKAKN